METEQRKHPLGSLDLPGRRCWEIDGKLKPPASTAAIRGRTHAHEPAYGGSEHWAAPACTHCMHERAASLQVLDCRVEVECRQPGRIGNCSVAVRASFVKRSCFACYYAERAPWDVLETRFLSRKVCGGSPVFYSIHLNKSLRVKGTHFISFCLFRSIYTHSYSESEAPRG